MSSFKKIRRRMERAAIVALLEEIREPSLSMILSGEQNEDHGVTEMFRCMIDRKIEEIRNG